MCKQIFLFALLIVCTAAATTSAPAQTIDRAVSLRSLVAAEQSFSRVSAEKGAREAFITFLADDGVLFNPSPVNGKKVWMPREKTPGILTWIPVFADVSDAGDLGFTTGPYEFRRAATEEPVGHGYYMSVWRRSSGGGGEWKVVLDIGTRNAPGQAIPALEFPEKAKPAKKKIEFEAAQDALKAADEDLSRFLSGEKTGGRLSEFIGDYLRVHRTNDLPFAEKNAALVALQTYCGKINSQTVAAGVSRSGDFGFSYGTYAGREAKTATAAKNNSAETGGFARIWRRDDKGKWKLTLVVMHAAPPGKRAGQ